MSKRMYAIARYDSGKPLAINEEDKFSSAEHLAEALGLELWPAASSTDLSVFCRPEKITRSFRIAEITGRERDEYRSLPKVSSWKELEKILLADIEGRTPELATAEAETTHAA